MTIKNGIRAKIEREIAMFDRIHSYNHAYKCALTVREAVTKKGKDNLFICLFPFYHFSVLPCFQ